MPCVFAAFDVRILALAAAAAVFGVAFGAALGFSRAWLKARLAGAPVGMAELVSMRMRGIPYGSVVDAYIMSSVAGLGLSVGDVERLYLESPNLDEAMISLVATKK